MSDATAMLGDLVAAAVRADLIVTVQLTDDDAPSWIITLATKDIWANGQRPRGWRDTGWGPRLADALTDLQRRMGPSMASEVARGQGLVQMEHERCSGCDRDMTAGRPHTEDCPLAIAQDAQDGDATALPEEER